MFQNNVPKRKISLGHPRKIWKDLIRKDVENVRPEERISKNWKWTERGGRKYVRQKYLKELKRKI